MVAPPQAKPKSKAEQEAQQKATRRAEQANILAGIRPLLEQDEQLLSFARARVAGGWRSKLNVGPEAFLAPFVNVALTERRFVVQHVRYPSGQPGAALPHTYLFEKVKLVSFTDIETYGSEPACRLILHLENELYVRLRLRGLLNVESAKNMAKLFDSLTLAKRRPVPSPTHSTCPQCTRTLEQRHRFCPYCGTQQPPLSTVGTGTAGTTGTEAHGITLATGTEQTAAETLQETLHSSTLPVVSSADLAAVPIETDFAYERDDRPAEFGFGVPFTAMEAEFELGDVEIASEQSGDEADNVQGETGMHGGVAVNSQVNSGLDSGSATVGEASATENVDGSVDHNVNSYSVDYNVDYSVDYNVDYEETLEPFATADLYASTKTDEAAGDILLPAPDLFESDTVPHTTEVPDSASSKKIEQTEETEETEETKATATHESSEASSNSDAHDFTSGEQTAQDTDSTGDRHE